MLCARNRTPALPWANAMNGGLPRSAPVAPVNITVPHSFGVSAFAGLTIRRAASRPTRNEIPMFISHMYLRHERRLFHFRTVATGAALIFILYEALFIACRFKLEEGKEVLA